MRALGRLAVHAAALAVLLGAAYLLALATVDSWYKPSDGGGGSARAAVVGWLAITPFVIVVYVVTALIVTRLRARNASPDPGKPLASDKPGA